MIAKREQEESKARQLHYALIDWQDFSIVAKVDFNADAVKELSMPLKRDDLINDHWMPEVKILNYQK